MKSEDYVFSSGAASRAEAAFGMAAEQYGVAEVNFTFDGHNDFRRRGIRVLTNAAHANPEITHHHITGTGTRFLNDNGRKAIDELFARSFSKA